MPDEDDDLEVNLRMRIVNMEGQPEPTAKEGDTLMEEPETDERRLMQHGRPQSRVVENTLQETRPELRVRVL